MTTSTDRTIILGRQPIGRGLRWKRLARPGDNLDYSIDATQPLTDACDTIVAASLSIQPSGTGELQACGLSVDGAVITVWLSGGVAGRLYTVKVVATGAGCHRWEWDVGLSMDPKLAVWPPSIAPSPGFGPEIKWPECPDADLAQLDFSKSKNSAFLAIL